MAATILDCPKYLLDELERNQSHGRACGEFMIHDLENMGESTLAFTTLEFKDSPNAPLLLTP